MNISFYDTFIIQNFKIIHFTLYFYKGIVLKIGVQNSLESTFTICRKKVSLEMTDFSTRSRFSPKYINIKNIFISAIAGRILSYY